MGEFDYLVVNENGKLDQTVETVKAIIIAERLRVKPTDGSCCDPARRGRAAALARPRRRLTTQSR